MQGEDDKKEVLVEFSMSPMDKGPSVSAFVARSLDVIDRSGLPYRLGPMGTCIEGDMEEVLDVFRKCFDVMKKDCTRISAVLKLDYRAGRQGRLETKMKSVESRLGRKIRK